MADITQRKQAHLDICLNENVEYGYTYLNEIQLVSKSLPELALADIDTSSHFLKKKIAAPIFISSMTGGSEDGASINKCLAESAEAIGIPFGLGSIRILFEQEECIKDFQMRKVAPNIPIFANLGAVQLRNIPHDTIFSMLDVLQVDAIALHLNPAQELAQYNGEDNFSSLVSQTSAFIARSPVPVIVKETGFGIMPTEAQLLLGYGAHYVDISGSGGTNWAKVEHLRNSTLKSSDHEYPQHDIYELGTATAILMLGLYKQPGILASGGIRTALDIVRCLVLGAEGVGLALPVLKHAVHGTEHTIDYLQHLIEHIAKTMLICGAENIYETRNIPFYIGQFLQKEFTAFSQAVNLRVPNALSKKIIL